MSGKGSRRRPENAKAIAARWPFKRKEVAMGKCKKGGGKKK